MHFFFPTNSYNDYSLVGAISAHFMQDRARFNDQVVVEKLFVKNFFWALKRKSSNTAISMMILFTTSGLNAMIPIIFIIIITITIIIGVLQNAAAVVYL